MIGEHITYAGGGGGPEAITLYNADQPIRRELGKCFSYDTCAGFVPERVIAHLAPGTPHSVLGEPLLTLRHDRPIESVAWSPTENLLAAYGILNNQAEQSSLTIWRVTPDHAELVSDYRLAERCWVPYGACSMTWAADNTINIQNQEIAFSVAVATGATTALPITPASYGDYFPSRIVRELLTATGNIYRRIAINNSRTGQVCGEINWASAAIAFNNDSSLLAAGGTELLTLWDMTGICR